MEARRHDTTVHGADLPASLSLAPSILEFCMVEVRFAVQPRAA